MIRVVELHVYPVKSLGGLAVPRAAVGDRGFLHDRRFMVVDGDGRFLTQRVLPRMALVATEIDGDRLRLSGPGAEPLEVPLAPDGPRIPVQVWRDTCPAVSAGEPAAAWLSRLLGRPCRLVYMPDDVLRPTAPDHGPGRVGFADAYPFLLVSLDSRAEVARRGGDVPIGRFRANLVVEGAAPFAEDRWRRVQVGTVVFRITTPCARCAVTTVDPARGAVAGPEPLRTLAAFRGGDEGVLFGVNMVQEEPGEVAAGDALTVLEEDGGAPGASSA